jgi:hypothetical protein
MRPAGKPLRGSNPNCSQVPEFRCAATMTRLVGLISDLDYIFRPTTV